MSNNNIRQFPAHSHKRSVKVHGSSIAYRESGSGDPIVFVHGGLHCSDFWQDMIPRVARYARCVAIDLPGFGDSDPLPQDADDQDAFIERQSDVFGEFLRAIGVESDVVLVAHGLGTMVALDWAFQHQERLKAIVHSAGCFVDSSRLAGIEFADLKFSQNFRSYFSDSHELVDAVIALLQEGELEERAFNTFVGRFPEARLINRTLLDYLLNLPSEGKPWRSHNLVLRYSTWLRFSKLPKLRIKTSLVSERFLARYHLVSDGFFNQTDFEIDDRHLSKASHADVFAGALDRWLKAESLIDASSVEVLDPA